MKNRNIALLLSLASISLAPIGPAASSNTPVELGTVNWLRDFDEANEKCQTTGKPLFILFQEVPGCSTCRNFGGGPLSHPLIAEAIESFFIPVAIFNNKAGHDEKILKTFQEPAWNNPAVRIVDSEHTALAPRLYGYYSERALVETLCTALQKANVNIPGYLELLRKETAATKRGTALFSMHCFWTGEAQLGQIDGVIATRPGFLHGKEVVEVSYDTAKISFTRLVREIFEKNYAEHLFCTSKLQLEAAQKIDRKRASLTSEKMRPDHQPQYFLSNTSLSKIKLTPMQSTKLNSFIYLKKDPAPLLSPKQYIIWKND